MDFRKDLWLSILAGVAISLGCWIYLSVPDKTIGAVLFSCGLLAVRAMNLNLFTGKVQFALTGKYPTGYYIIVLMGNMVGVLLTTIMSFKLTGFAARQVAILKENQSFIESFIKGIGCGALMTIATYRKAPLYVSVFCVSAFIIAGFNHCVADAYYFLCGGTVSVNWFTTLAGNIVGGIIMGTVNEQYRRNRR